MHEMAVFAKAKQQEQAALKKKIKQIEHSMERDMEKALQKRPAAAATASQRPILKRPATVATPKAQPALEIRPPAPGSTSPQHGSGQYTEESDEDMSALAAMMQPAGTPSEEADDKKS